MNRVVHIRRIPRCSISPSATVRFTHATEVPQTAQDAKVDIANQREFAFTKIHTGIWSYNGVFHLVDSWRERDEYRKPCSSSGWWLAEGEEDFDVPPSTSPSDTAPNHSDVGRETRSLEARRWQVRSVVQRTSSTSTTTFHGPEGDLGNVRERAATVCHRHNLEKRDRILSNPTAAAQLPIKRASMSNEQEKPRSAQKPSKGHA